MCSIRIAVVLANSFWTLAAPAEEQITPDVQKQLLQKASDWKIPQPPAMSKIVKMNVFCSWDAKSGKYTKNYALGFVDPGNPHRALVGFDWWDVEVDRTILVRDVHKLSLDDISATSPFSEAHGVNFGLITGIQFLRSGDENLGLALINKSICENAGHPYSKFYSRSGEPSALILARSCLAAALNRITTAKPDFTAIRRDIEQLLADQPALRNKGTDWVLESLQANVAYAPAASGTMEKIVEDYLLCGGRTGIDSISKAEQVLILKGFDAVPTLLDQRHSKRFSNHLMPGVMNFPSYPMMAGQVIDQYLQRLANKTMNSDRILDPVLDDDELGSWWKMAQEIGEENYVAKYTVTLDHHKETSLSEPLLMIASSRYPHLLPGIYIRILETSYPSWKVAEAITNCDSIPRNQKIELFKAAITTNEEAHRNTALEQLHEIDSNLSDIDLIRIVKQASGTTKKQYWSDQDAHLGRHVAACNKLDVWNELHVLLDRADLGMQMELINNLYPPRNAAPQILQSFYEIYLRYHDDSWIRDESTSKKFDGPGAGFLHKQIALRDFIHIHWARWLKLRIRAPEQEATPQEWDIYRATVRNAVLHNQQRIELKGLLSRRHDQSTFIGCVIILCLAAIGIAAMKCKSPSTMISRTNKASP